MAFIIGFETWIAEYRGQAEKVARGRKDQASRHMTTGTVQAESRDSGIVEVIGLDADGFLHKGGVYGIRAGPSTDASRLWVVQPATATAPLAVLDATGDIQTVEVQSGECDVPPFCNPESGEPLSMSKACMRMAPF